MTPQDLKLTLSEWLAVPVDMLGDSWTMERVEALDACLREHILGQDQAIAEAVSALKRYAALGRNNNRPRPIASFLFVGPSGVGKTELARRAAEFLFGDSQNRFIKIECAQYSEKHNLSAFWGAPPGYVGYGQPTDLDRVRKNPYSLVLFDEIEKMHPEAVTHLLVGLLGDGAVKDMSYGRLVNFANTICVFTSNLGNQFARHSGQRIGYQQSGEDEIDAAHIREAVEEFFSPEILGRIDSIVVFNRLTNDVLGRLLDRELRDFAGEKLGGVDLVVSGLARQLILFEAQSNDFGARRLKQVLAQRIESKTADLVLQGSLRIGGRQRVSVDVDEAGDFVFSVTPSDPSDSDPIR